MKDTLAYRLLTLNALACLLAGLLGIPAMSAPQLREAIAQLTPTPPATALNASFAPACMLCTHIAPLFEHGAGYGLNGWDAGNCPVMLSKEDACAVIIEEARGAGLHFTPNADTLYNILPVQGRAANESLPAPTRSLTLDGSDATRKVSFVFVSATDANSWRKKCGQSLLGEGIDIHGYASSLRDVLASAPLDGYYAVFYDPAITVDDLPQATAGDPNQQTVGDLTSEARDYAGEQLRQQVRDFIAWLKTQNVTLS
jgi:hypothetical protein